MRVHQGSESLPIEPKDALWLLSNFSVLHQRSFDAEALARECIPPLCVDDLSRIGAKLGLDLSSSHAAIDLAKVRLPLAVLVRSNADPTVNDSVEWLLVLQIDSNDAMVARANGKPPQQVALNEVTGAMTGPVLRCTVKASDSVDPDIAAAASRKFGFSWFVPELLKHKKIWREVLVASLVLQLMALAFPLFT